MKHLMVLTAALAALSGCASMQQKSSSSPQAADKPATTTAAASNSQEVKGINGWSGSITGTPAANSKFKNLKIGMGIDEVLNIAGRPTNTSSHITGKAWIPFYYGSGKYETIFYYKGVGQLIFAGGAGIYHYGYNDPGAGLILIKHDTSERGFD